MSESADGDEDAEWRFSLSDLEDDEEGPGHEPVPIEPESPALENVAFVVVGVALALLVLVAGF